MSTLTLRRRLCTEALKDLQKQAMTQIHKCFTSGVQNEVIYGILWDSLTSNDKQINGSLPFPLVKDCS